MLSVDRSDELDRIDLKILTELSSNGRISWRELAETIGLSLTPTLRRVRHLEQAGYVRGYSAHLDEARLAGSISVFVAVSLERQSQDHIDAFEREIAVAPPVMSCFMIAGDADYILRVVVNDLNEYQAFLTSTLMKIRGVAHIKSSFALKSVLNRAAPLVRTSQQRKPR